MLVRNIIAWSIYHLINLMLNLYVCSYVYDLFSSKLLHAELIMLCVIVSVANFGIVYVFQRVFLCCTCGMPLLIGTCE